MLVKTGIMPFFFDSRFQHQALASKAACAIERTRRFIRQAFPLNLNMIAKHVIE